MPAHRTLRQRLSPMVPQSVRFNARRAIYRGKAVECLLCGSKLDRFVSHGGGAEVLDRRRVVGGMERHDDSCPACHGADRTRLMMLFLKNELAKNETRKSILHVAPDLGLYMWLMRQRNIDYTAADMDIQRYRHIRNVVKADLVSLQFPDNHFDFVVCSHVLEHVPDDAAAMREIYRVLKPGGVAVLMVPLATDGGGTDEDPTVVDPRDRAEKFGQWDHVRLYGRDDFVRRLREAKFDVTWFNGVDQYPAEAAALLLNPAENIAVSRKV